MPLTLVMCSITAFIVMLELISYRPFACYALNTLALHLLIKLLRLGDLLVMPGNFMKVKMLVHMKLLLNLLQACF